jgi:hypothetical protein
VTRRALGSAAGVLTAAFLIVLAVPARDRALALLAFAILAGTLAVAGAVASLLAAAPSAGEEPLRGHAAPADQRPGDLAAIEVDVRDALASGRVDERLRTLAISIAAARLARRHRIELAADPDGARRVLGEGAAWKLLTSSRSAPTMRPAELAALVDELEAI